MRQPTTLTRLLSVLIAGCCFLSQGAHPSLAEHPLDRTVADLVQGASGLAERDALTTIGLPGLAYACLSTIASARQPNRRSLQVAADVADRLLITEIYTEGPSRGWGYEGRANCNGPGTADAFGDGSCNAATTAYAFQTGLAITCLARATISTRDVHYAELGQRILRYWASLTTTPCPSCIYFPYSDSVNDRNRYVRNTNVLMGMAAAWLYRATEHQYFADLAIGVLESEAREMRLNNTGYFGVDDPRYASLTKRPSKQMDNHYIYISKGLWDIGHVMKNGTALSLARKALVQWVTCTGADCSRLSCKQWSGNSTQCGSVPHSVAPCFISGEAFLDEHCKRLLPGLVRPNYFQLWGLADRAGLALP